MAKQTKNAPTEEPKVSNPTNEAPEGEAFDWGQEGATGFEGTRPEDLGIPYVSLMQKGSPEVDDTHPDHESVKIEGIRAGMMINTLTREIIYAKDDSNPVLFIPMFHQKLYQEWKPRSAGGGFVQSHGSPIILTKCKRSEKNEDVLPNGNIIRTTSYFAGLLLKDGITDVQHPDEALRPQRAVLAMSSTQLKKARSWLNMMHAIKIEGRTPPMYSHIYRLTSVVESNEKGNWYGFKIEIDRILTMKDVGVITTSKQVAGDMAATRLLAAPSSQEASPEDDQADAEAAAQARKVN